MSIYSLQSIETTRLILRPTQESDYQALYALIEQSQDSLKVFMPWARKISQELTQAYTHYAHTCWKEQIAWDYPMTLIEKATGQIIGASGFNANSVPVKPFFEIGYWLDVRSCGKGFATEACAALSQYAFQDLGANRVQLSTSVLNHKSIAVAQRCGFQMEAIRRCSHTDIQGEDVDGTLWGLGSLSDLSYSVPLIVHRLPQKPEPERSVAPIGLQGTSPSSAHREPCLLKLYTERCLLKTPEVSTCNRSYVALMSSLDQVSPYFTWASNSLTLERHIAAQTEMIAGSQDPQTASTLIFDVLKANSAEFLGQVWLKRHPTSGPGYYIVAYWFATQSSGQGYATEAVREVIAYAFKSLGAYRVELDISRNNTKSLALAHRLQIPFEGWLKNHSRDFVTNTVHDSALFAVTNCDITADAP